MARPLAERFWEKVGQSGPTECWPWLAGRGGGEYDYGHIRHNGETINAHRVAWELTYGLIPEGVCVCHHCDDRMCCNPAHLFLGTRADNNTDKAQKGRSFHPSGEKHGRSALTDVMVLEIRRLYAGGSVLQRELSATYGVSQQQISFIVNRRAWAHI